MAIRKKISGSMERNVPVNFEPQAPDLFVIPRPYEDDYERNTAWYLQMHRLEKRLKTLRKSYTSLLMRHELLHFRTKQTIDSSLKLIRRFQQKGNNRQVT